MLKDDDISEHSHCWVETLPTNSATGLESHQWRSSIGYGKIIRLQHRCHIGNPGSLVLRPKPLECPLAIELATPPKNYSGGSSSSRAAFQPTDCLVDECCPWSCRNPPPKAPRSPQTWSPMSLTKILRPVRSVTGPWVPEGPKEASWQEKATPRVCPVSFDYLRDSTNFHLTGDIRDGVPI
ncbi:hypothetical protein OPV22_031597 [Ensete ventricosum]|uniref:Uncharacterized protein n=1 Tax=Ensete ventricosum TaxID=4639 RepID=A0AAV8PL12_ENSVE|nr:hypothetical protein OPV22_031597 [Ensete ventricosum]